MEESDSFAHSVQELRNAYQMSKKEAEKVLKQKKNIRPPVLNKNNINKNIEFKTKNEIKEEVNPYSIFKEKERKTFIDKKELRRAIIYKEILDLPKAFKE